MLFLSVVKGPAVASFLYEVFIREKLPIIRFFSIKNLPKYLRQTDEQIDPYSNLTVLKIKMAEECKQGQLNPLLAQQ